MSIKLRFEKGSMDTKVILTDDALPKLLALISEHQSEEATPPAQSNVFADSLVDSSGDRSVVAKAWLNKHSAAEVLNKIKWDTNPEKILLMGAFHESKVETDSWRSADMQTWFSEAKNSTGQFSTRYCYWNQIWLYCNGHTTDIHCQSHRLE